MNDPAFKQVRLSSRTLTRHFDGFVASLRRDTPETRGTYTHAHSVNSSGGSPMIRTFVFA